MALFACTKSARTPCLFNNVLTDIMQKLRFCVNFENSYPECQRFESTRRYHEKTVQIERFALFFFVRIAQKIAFLPLTRDSYTSPSNPEWHKPGIFLIFMSKKFSISKQLWNQYFVYTSDSLLLLVFTGMIKTRAEEPFFYNSARKQP